MDFNEYKLDFYAFHRVDIHSENAPLSRVKKSSYESGYFERDIDILTSNRWSHWNASKFNQIKWHKWEKERMPKKGKKHSGVNSTIRNGKIEKPGGTLKTS